MRSAFNRIEVWPEGLAFSQSHHLRRTGGTRGAYQSSLHIAPEHYLFPGTHLYSKARGNLNRDPLDLIERKLILSPVVELGRPRALVVGDMLRGFEGALVLQVRRGAGRAKRVVSDPALNSFSTSICRE
jgi:hypothetical protein